MDTDVLIVGAGPTGLMLANQLARAGVRFMIIDRHSGPAQQTRAVGVQPRTLEIYQQLGVADRALALGRRTEGGNIWANGRRSARIPVGDIGRGETAFPFILILGQDDNERILGEHLAELGSRVEWNTELVNFTQQPDHVAAILKLPDGSTRNITASWVAGCDGARSTVREACGIPFLGAPYEHVFFVADTVATGNMVPNELNVYLWKRGFHLFFPMRGDDHWRVIGILPDTLMNRPSLTFDDVVPHLREQAGESLAFRECTWFSTYRIHHRAAQRFREGRCFLLGDAAHIHSPMGAQGMNTGLQDAYNLAWKLALVIRGEATPPLLDTYDAERRPVAQRLLRTTDRAFMFVVKDNWIAALVRTRILAKVVAFAMRREEVRRAAFSAMSQLGIQYRASPLSQGAANARDAPQPGDRFPWLELEFTAGASAGDLFQKLDGTRFNLLIFGQDAAPKLDDANVRVHVIPDTPANRATLARVHIAGPGYYLLRPDGYVGLAGSRIDARAINAYTSAIARS